MPLLETLRECPEDLLLLNGDLQQDTLSNLKASLDKVAPLYSPLDIVHVDGLRADQIWVQAQMVLNGVAEKASAKYAEYSGADDHESSPEESSTEEIGLEDEELDSSELEDSELEESEDINEVDEINEQLSDEDAASHRPNDDISGEDYINESNGDGADDPKNTEFDISDGLEEDQGNTEEEKFDLAEFQQHVLQLEQDGSEDEEEVDFNAEIGDSSDDTDLHYNEFFGPTPKRNKPETKRQKGFDTEDVSEEENVLDFDNQDEDGEPDYLEMARKDLFNDDDGEGSDSQMEENLSNFEKQQQELARQIEQLEAENVGEKNWGMRGEAKAKDRPEDGLFGIQFDRSAKPAPVITEESTSTIEELIKNRIKKQQFDDIPRRSEGAAQTDLKRELPELSERKSEKSLAELYEEDQMRKSNPEYFAKQDSATTDAAHKEVIDLFTSVTRKLDALCSWSHTPKAAVPSLQIVTDAPSISMEDAQPGTLAPQHQLAPQEVYKGESAVPMDSSEMSTSLKRKKRRDKSKAKTKAAGKESDSKSQVPNKKDSKESMFNTLKRGNVTLVDKRGNKRDLRGNTVKERGPQLGPHIKL